MAIESMMNNQTQENTSKPESLPMPSQTVKVTGKTRVSPANSIDKPDCPLITFDTPYITFYYNQKLILYKLDNEKQFEEVVEKLKQGLGLVLEEFYPLAGKLKQDDDGALVVECKGESVQGAEVIEAVLEEDVSLEDLAENGDASGILKELVPYNGVMNLEGLHRPLLAVQFTKLKDGIAIGCAFNHAILDGNSTWHFMSSWASATSASSSTSSSPGPIHDRFQVRPVKIPLTLPASAEAHELADPNRPPKPLRAKLFSFSAAAVQHLKSTANNNINDDNNNRTFSTFQSLGAHMWKSISRARGLPPDVPTVFAIFADCRQRMDPPLPYTYFGNLIQAVFTATAAGLLAANPLSFSAELLQKAIDMHDSKAILKRLEEYEANPKLFHYSDAGFNPVAVGSSPRFKVYDVDFGFGKPARVRSGANNKFDGMIYLYPGRDGDGSIDVELTLDGEAMAKLEKDEEFLGVLG